MDQGFYVEVKKEEKYEGPFVSLNQARDEARKIGPNLKIKHGVLSKNEDGTYNTTDLFLVPKVKK